VFAHENCRNIVSHITYTSLFFGPNSSLGPLPSGGPQLLEQPETEQAVRVGDVFALLIEYFHAQNNAGAFQQAYNLIERMRDRNIVITPYLDQAIIDRVYDAMGIAQPQRPGAAALKQQHGHNDDDEVGDEIPEEDL
jgi:intraflagellar transport protein 140